MKYVDCGVNMATIQHGLEDMLTTARELNAQVDLALEQRDFAPLLDVYEKVRKFVNIFMLLLCL